MRDSYSARFAKAQQTTTYAIFRKEVNVIKKYSIIEQFGLTFDIYVPRVSLFIAILTYVLTGNNINAEKVFMMSAFCTILGSSMTIGFALSKLLAIYSNT